MGTYQELYGNSILLTLAIFPVWCFAGWAFSILVRRKTLRGLKFAIVLSLFFLLGATVLTLWRVVLLVRFAGFGLRLLPTNFLLSFIFLLPTLVLILLWGLPPLWKMLRTPRPIELETRSGLIAPALAAPVQMSVAGAFLAAVINVAAPSLILDVMCIAVWLAYGIWRWIRQDGLQRSLEERGLEALPGFWSRLGRRSAVVLCFAAGLGLLIVTARYTSRLPDKYSMNMMSGGHQMQMAAGATMLNVSQLAGPNDGVPDRRFSLTAQKTQIRLGSGKTVQAWTYNSQAPGPELRVRQGELVEVTLENRDVEPGVTIHWHGVNVPNAEDGVAGLTQDAVLPGERFVYRFRANDTGTYWYHSHQSSMDEVAKGMFGAFIVDPPEAPRTASDITVTVHMWQTDSGLITAFGRSNLERKAIAPDSDVRLRLINTDSFPRQFSLTGTPFQIAAIDGVDVNQPGELDRARLTLAGGGRYDLQFRMPHGPVLLSTGDPNFPVSHAEMLLSVDGNGEVAPAMTTSDFDPAVYGKSVPGTINSHTHFDHEYVLDFEVGAGFFDGDFGFVWLINGRKYPNTETITVREGELIKITFVNRTIEDHPMHPHGHRMLVLSRNGKPVSGSPWWTDTLNVPPGEILEVAMKADNPGLWMDHCHNLFHAAGGFVMHLMYENVMTPFQVGRTTRNHPE